MTDVVIVEPAANTPSSAEATEGESATIQVEEQVTEQVETTTDAAVEIAEIQADRDVEIAEINAEVAETAIEASARERELETEVRECRILIASMSTEMQELREQLSILQPSEAQQQMSQSLESESPEVTQVFPKDHVEAPEPAVKRKHLKLI